jgi:thiol-disulfide isomerase/thioredoxin
MKTLMTFVLAAASVTTAMADGLRTAPEFVINMTDGSQKLLSSYKGKPICLAFFFTTCPHCQDMAKMLSSQIVPDEEAKTGTPQFVANYVKGYPMGWAERGSVLEFLQVSIMTPLYVPIMVFIDRNGKVQDQYIGDPTFLKDPPKNVRAELDKILAVKATSVKPVTRISKK